MVFLWNSFHQIVSWFSFCLSRHTLYVVCAQCVVYSLDVKTPLGIVLFCPISCYSHTSNFFVSYILWPSSLKWKSTTGPPNMLIPPYWLSLLLLNFYLLCLSWDLKSFGKPDLASVNIPPMCCQKIFYFLFVIPCNSVCKMSCFLFSLLDYKLLEYRELLTITLLEHRPVLGIK